MSLRATVERFHRIETRPAALVKGARSRFRRWVSGFVSGEYNPLSQPQQGEATPTVSHFAGSPFAPGGAYHENASGWRDATKTKKPASADADPEPMRDAARLRAPEIPTRLAATA